MRNFYTLFKYEMHKLLVMPSTYVVFAIFATSIGAIFALLLYNYVKFEQDVPFIQMFFRCFWLPTCVIVPLMSMGSFSEEYKSGTFQSLFSTTASPGEVVLVKFSVLYLAFVALWLCSLLVVMSADVSSFADGHAFASEFNVVGGLLFICLVSVFFIGVGVFSSSLTENQIVSCMATFFILIGVFVGGQFLANGAKISNLSLAETYRESLGIFLQLDNFCEGVIDSRVVVFYLSLGALALCLSPVAVQRKLN
jgi:ABC-2 type transport system permease protein